MTHQTFTSEKENQVLLSIHEGMLIYDWEDKKVGAVSYVQFPSESAEETTFIAGLNNVPRAMQERLMREGFIMVAGGLFTPDRYITPDQILEVTDTEIILKVLKAEVNKF